MGISVYAVFGDKAIQENCWLVLEKDSKVNRFH